MVLPGMPRGVGVGYRPVAEDVAAAADLFSGEYYTTDRFNSPGGYGASNAVLIANRLHAFPIWLDARVYDRIAIHVGTSAAGANVRVAVFDRGISSTNPIGNLLFDPGSNLSAAATGIVEQTISWMAPRDDWYFVTVHSDGTPSLGGAATGFCPIISLGMTDAGRFTHYYKDPVAFGAPPATFPASPLKLHTTFARVGLRAA